MDAKLSVILNLTRFEHDEFIFINQLKKQSLQEIQIVVISDIDDKTLEDKCLKLYSDDSRISFYTSKQPRDKIRITGEYVYYANTAAILRQDALEYMYKYMQTNDSELCICNYAIEADHLKIVYNLNKSQALKYASFSYETRISHIFNLATLDLSNYCFKTSFLAEKQLLLQKYDTVSKILLVLKSLICKDNPNYIFSKLITYNNNILATSDNWKNVFTALEIFYKSYLSNDAYKRYFGSFLNLYLNYCYIIIKSCLLENEHLEIIKFIKHNVLRKYNFFRYEKDFYHSKTAYNYLWKFFQKTSLPHISQNIRQKYKKTIDIVLPCSETLAPFTGVTLFSILEHISAEYFYNIHILHSELIANTYNRFLAMAKQNVNIFNLDVSQKLCEFNAIENDKSFYYKALMTDIFPDYEKIIYADAFVMFTSDVAELENIDNRRKCFINILQNNKLSPKSDVKSKVLLFNPSLCKKNLMIEKYLTVLENFSADSSEDLFSAFKLGSKQTPAKEIYLSIDNPQQHFAKDEQEVDRWWKYARTTPFYEWIVYNQLIIKKVQE